MLKPVAIWPTTIRCHGHFHPVVSQAYRYPHCHSSAFTSLACYGAALIQYAFLNKLMSTLLVGFVFLLGGPTNLVQESMEASRGAARAFVPKIPSHHCHRKWTCASTGIRWREMRHKHATSQGQWAWEFWSELCSPSNWAAIVASCNKNPTQRLVRSNVLKDSKVDLDS